MVERLSPYPAYKPSGVEWLGDVPAHWTVRRLRNLAEMRASNVDKHVRDEEQPVRLCNYVDVYKHERIGPDIDFMPATAKADEFDRFKLATGDVLITKDSEDWTDIGVPALVEGAPGDVLCGYHLALLRPHADLMQGQFLLRALQTKAVASQFHIRANGVTRYGLSHDAIKSVWLPVPPLSEQVAIARLLDNISSRIDRYIHAKKKLIGLQEEQKRAMIQEAVTGRVDVRSGKPYRVYKPSGVKWLGSVPTHWDVRPAKWHLKEVDERSVNGTEEMLSVSHLTGVTPRSEKSVTMFKAESNIGHKLCEPGDLVINTMWAWMGALGIAQQHGLVSPSYGVYRPKNNSSLHRRYAEMMLRSAPLQCEYVMRSTGIRPSRLRLYPDTFLRIRLIAPPAEEQSAIIAFVANETARCDRASKRMTEQITAVQEYRARLVVDVITGKLDVRQAASDLDESLAGKIDVSRENHGLNSRGGKRHIALEATS